MLYQEEFYTHVMGWGEGLKLWGWWQGKKAATATTLVTGYVLISWWKMYNPKIKKKNEVRYIFFMKDDCSHQSLGCWPTRKLAKA